MNNYKPAFNRQDVRDRCIRSLTWAKSRLKDGPVELPTKTIENYFGSRGNLLGMWLKQTLLKVERDYWAQAKKCRVYSLNEEGVRKVTDLLQAADGQISKSARSKTDSAAAKQGVHPLITTSCPALARSKTDSAAAKQGVHPLISSSSLSQVGVLEFTYDDRSSRHWHELQNIPRPDKSRLWCEWGLPYNYDISTCAPHVITQLAQKAGIPDLAIGPVLSYLDDKTVMRSKFTSILECSSSDAKNVITSLFNGARISESPFTAICEKYGKDAVKRLKADRDVMLLYKAVNRMWPWIERMNGKTYRGGKAKSALYYHHELQVIDCVISYLKARSIRHFTEHDGWRTEVRLDVDLLERHIFNSTGFKFTIEEEISL